MKCFKNVFLVCVLSLSGLLISACSHNDNPKPAKSAGGGEQPDNIPDTINLAATKGPTLSQDELVDLKSFLEQNRIHSPAYYVIKDPNSNTDPTLEMLQKEDPQFQHAVRSMTSLCTIVQPGAMKPVDYSVAQQIQSLNVSISGNNCPETYSENAKYIYDRIKVDAPNKTYVIRSNITGQLNENINEAHLQKLVGFSFWSATGGGLYTYNVRPSNPRIYGKMEGQISYKTPAKVDIEVSLTSETLSRRGPNGDSLQKIIVFKVSRFQKDLFFSAVSDNKVDQAGNLILSLFLNGAPIPQDLLDAAGSFVISLMDQNLRLNNDGTLMDLGTLKLDSIDTSKN